MKKIFKKIGNVLKKRWLINTTSTLALIAIVIAIYVSVNILLENVVLPEIDFTENKMYSISQESIDKVKNINKQIKFTLINYSDNVSIMNFVDRYVEVNNNIKIEKIDDLSVRNDLMVKYSLEPNDMAIIVSSDNNEKFLSSDSLYEIDYSTFEQIDKTEEAFTNAILDVTTEKKPKIYFMLGHAMYGEEYFSTLMQTMKDEANEVKKLDILSNGGIPDDCDCLIITTLKSDLTEQEADKIIAYINNGGNILMLCGPNITNVELTNFQKVLDEYGLNLGKGVIFEGDSSNMLAGYPDFLLEEVQNSKITKTSKNKSYLCLMDAGNISFNADKKDVEYEVIASTSEKAFERTDIAQNSVTRTQNDGEEKSATVGAICTKNIDENKKSELIIFANELFAMNMPIQINGYTMYMISMYNNKDMVLNSISLLNQRENTITIRKQQVNSNYTVTDEQDKIITAITFAVPILIMVAGIGVWTVRRRKK